MEDVCDSEFLCQGKPSIQLYGSPNLLLSSNIFYACDFQPGAILFFWEHLTTPGNMFGFHNWGRRSWHLVDKARDATKNSITQDRPPQRRIIWPKI